MSRGFATPIPAEAFKGMRALNTQSYIESNVKLGLQFTLTVEITIPVGASAYYRVKAPSDSFVVVKQRLINTNGGMRYTPLAGATYTPNAEQLIPLNLNGNSATVSQVLINTVDAVNVTDEGVVVDIVRSVNGQGAQDEQGIFAGDGLERILAKDGDLLLKFENLDNSDVWVVYSITWYEGLLDMLPLEEA